MSDDDAVLVIIGVLFALALIAAVIAAVKRRNAFFWFVATLAFAPLFLVLLFLPARGQPRAPGRPSMPSWTQPPPRRAEHSGEDAARQIEQRLQRVGIQVQNTEAGRRILAALKARTEQQEAEPGKSPQQQERESKRLRRATVQTDVRVSGLPIRQGGGVVQRSGSRETRIFRRG